MSMHNMIKKCQQCNSEFKTYPSKIKKFCSAKCYHLSRVGKPSPLRGRNLVRVKEYVFSEEGLKKRVEANKKRVWTKEMKEKLKDRKRPEWIYLRGEANPNWKKDKSRTERMAILRKTVAYSEWRTAVFERDGYACVECGDDKGGNLEADHIKPFAYFPELRFDINNGRTLCTSCHKKTETWGARVHKCTV